ncbi:hypothetical protein [Pyrinomonas methylaliphatogenes]|uniref:DUF1360 domain-containing protein n=1 Tax=Pyrinomonas methylaliphatogenes TaxID=454194 RepID=A0A0B6WZW3_9BACT|nr:hypothetical protein [Pyrinomonas methylaliphatogenes]CDM66823.1 hypothetical protein PYK22_02861 [Pyrinomonas methylaliphatogenes]
MGLSVQIVWLFVLAIPVACISWTVTHEEIFREPREFCLEKSRTCRRLFERKFFYLFTCEYCFSHHVVVIFLLITRYKLLFADWRGYLIAGFALVWIANQYMSLYGRLRLDISHERLDIEAKRVEMSESSDSKGD